MVIASALSDSCNERRRCPETEWAREIHGMESCDNSDMVCRDWTDRPLSRKRGAVILGLHHYCHGTIFGFEEDIKEEVIDVSLSALSYAWVFYATAKNLWSPETSQDSGVVSMALGNQTTRDNSTVVETPYVQENFIEPENGGVTTGDTATTSQNAAGDAYASNSQHPQSTVALDSHSLPSQQIKNAGQTKKKGKWRLLNFRRNEKQTEGRTAEKNFAVDHVV